MAARPSPPQDLADAAGRGLAAAREFVAARGGSPLVDASAATFVWFGDAVGVSVRPWVDIFPPIPPLALIGDSQVWWTTVEMPPAARIEYKLEVHRSGRRRLVLDQLNPVKAAGPAGWNSVATGPGYEPTAYPGGPRGRLVDLPIRSKAFGETRHAKLYLPHGYAGAPIPLVAVHDGSEYLDFADLGMVLDSLNRTTPVAALVTDPADRLREYGASDRHAGYLVEEAIPAARRQVDASGLVALGASMGGIASLHAARGHPGTFATLVLQSASFVEALGGPFHRGRAFAPAMRFMRELWANPGDLPGRMHLSCGQYDGLIGDNRRTAGRLRELGVDVGWAEAPAAHDWALWRDLLGAGLRFALASQRTP